MSMTSKKPYYIRALYDWNLDNNFTPYILVNADYPDVDVPSEHVNAGRIVLNISPDACRGLHIGNDRIVFTARFSGKTTQIYIHPGAVLAIYAQENGEGQEFELEHGDFSARDNQSQTSSVRKPKLTLVQFNTKND